MRNGGAAAVFISASDLVQLVWGWDKETADEALRAYNEAVLANPDDWRTELALHACGVVCQSYRGPAVSRLMFRVHDRAVLNRWAADIRRMYVAGELRGSVA